MRIIAIANQKGGVGKTTSTINIGAGLSELKKRVLLVDLDPQAHLTYSLGIQAHELKISVYNLLTGGASLEEVLIDRQGLHILPSNLELSGMEIEIAGIKGGEFLLKEALEQVDGSYDFALIDCPPSLGPLTVNALTSAYGVYIPLQVEYLALQGLSMLLRTVEVVQDRLNRRLEIAGIIGTRYDSRKRLNKEIIAKIEGYFGKKLFNTLIRDNVSLAEAPGFGQSIFEYKPRSYGAEDYLNLCREILKRKI